MDLVRYTGSNEWSALYVDGILDTIGDHYLIDERISVLTNVTVINSDAFFLDGDTREGAAKTLEVVHAYEAEINANNELADQLENEARKLLERAEELRK